MSIYTATRFPWPLLWPVPLGTTISYHSPKPLSIVFCDFFSKSLVSLARQWLQGFYGHFHIHYILYKASKDLSLSPLSIYIIQYHLDQCQEFLCKLPGKFTGQEFSSDPGQRKITGHVFVYYAGKFYVLHKSGHGFSALSFSPKIRESFCAIRRNPFPRPGSLLSPPYNGCEKYSIYIYSIYSTG